MVHWSFFLSLFHSFFLHVCFNVLGAADITFWILKTQHFFKNLSLRIFETLIISYSKYVMLEYTRPWFLAIGFKLSLKTGYILRSFLIKQTKLQDLYIEDVFERMCNWIFRNLSSFKKTWECFKKFVFNFLNLKIVEKDAKTNLNWARHWKIHISFKLCICIPSKAARHVQYTKFCFLSK